MEESAALAARGFDRTEETLPVNEGADIAAAQASASDECPLKDKVDAVFGFREMKKGFKKQLGMSGTKGNTVFKRVKPLPVKRGVRATGRQKNTGKAYTMSTRKTYGM
jgi:hypothetical protein